MIIYLPALVLVLAIKIFYQTADSNALAWILAPTTGWVSVLSGISFENIPHVGYVNHAYRFIIAPSCSGIRFMLIIFIMTLFSFTYRISALPKKTLWFLCSAAFSYVSAVFVNGIRITASIYLPLILTANNLMNGWITAESLHTIIGTSVYFSSLFLIYYLAGKLCTRFFIKAYPPALQQGRYRFIAPVFWYFVMVLGLPFFVRLYRNNWDGFWQYALLITGICVCVTILLFLFGRLRSLILSKCRCLR